MDANKITACKVKPYKTNAVDLKKYLIKFYILAYI